MSTKRQHQTTVFVSARPWAPNQVEQGCIDHTQRNMSSWNEIADVEFDEATPFVEGIGEGRATHFNGKIEKVTLEIR
jgi:hypothetical protein